MSDWNTSHLEIVVKMYTAKVTGSHHKQRDTIQRWSNLEGDRFTEALDELIADPEAPVREKGRGTVQLTGIQAAREFVEENDTDGAFSWHLDR